MFWLRLLPQRNEKAFFNPYVLATLSFTDRVVRFFHAALSFVPGILISLIIVAFLIVLRGVLMARFDFPWQETNGMWIVTGKWTSPGAGVLFSLVSFGLLVYRLWVLELLLGLFIRPRQRNRTHQALSCLTMPVSMLPRLSRFAILFCIGAGLALALQHIGEARFEWEVKVAILRDAEPPPVFAFPALTPQLFCILGAGSMVDVLGMMRDMLLLFILFTFIGRFNQSPLLSSLGHEGIDMLSRVIFPKPLRWGWMDWRPILLLFALAATQQIAIRLLSIAIR